MANDSESLEQEPTTDGIKVFFVKTSGFPYPTAEIEAELPDGTRLGAIEQLDGHRVGFDRAVPQGTWIVRAGH